MITLACGREMVGGGDAGDAGADDGEIEFLHGLTLQGRCGRACNSWAAMNIAHLLLGAAQEFRDVTALARGEPAVSQLSRPLAQGLGDEHAPRARASACRGATAWPSP